MSRAERFADAGAAAPSVEDVVMAAVEDGGETGAAADMGAVLRARRHARGLSLEQLSERSGVSRSMISKVERNEAMPSTAVLARIAEALGVTFSELMQPDAEGEVVVLHRGQQPVMTDPETGFERRCIAPILPSRGIDWVQNTLPPGRSTGTFVPHRRGVDEYVYVLAGHLRARLGEGDHVLQAGDSLYFEAHVPHAFDNIGAVPCVYLLVIDSRGVR